MAAHVLIGGDDSADHPSLVPKRADRSGALASADVPELVLRLLARLPVEGPGGGGISVDALALLQAQHWPGVLQLERALLAAVILSEGGELMPQDFPQFLPENAAGLEQVRNGSHDAAAGTGVADREHALGERPPAAAARADRGYFARYGVSRLLDERGEMRPIGALEEEAIRFAIDHYRRRMSEVARRLGIGRSTLYRKIKDYGIATVESIAS